jgi:predicted GNAT family acetyltransferase
MKVVTYAAAAEFWQAAAPLLTADPVRNTVLLSITNRLVKGVVPPDITPILLTVHDGPDVIGAALCTPPNSIMVSAVPPRAAAAVVEQLRADHIQLPGAIGVRPAVEAFAAAWSDSTGDELIVQMPQRLYRLHELTPPTNVPGQAHEATEADVALVVDWRSAFIAEALGHEAGHSTLAEATRQVRSSLAMGNGLILWHAHDEPVAFAAVGRPTEHMSRIGPVYTPPRHRGHGYGSAVTAAAATWALSRHATHIVLFTDVTNPVSNSIYQRIGFRPVAEALDVAFRPTPLP